MLEIYILLKAILLIYRILIKREKNRSSDKEFIKVIVDKFFRKI